MIWKFEEVILSLEKTKNVVEIELLFQGLIFPHVKFCFFSQDVFLIPNICVLLIMCIHVLV